VSSGARAHSSERAKYNASGASTRQAAAPSTTNTPVVVNSVRSENDGSHRIISPSPNLIVQPDVAVDYTTECNGDHNNSTTASASPTTQATEIPKTQESGRVTSCDASSRARIAARHQT
jgi:hypothetical protein